MGAAVAQDLARCGEVGNRACALVSGIVAVCLCMHILSCNSIDSDAVTVLPRLGGDFSGEEKMPEMGSKPCSSYTPRSASTMPVFLQHI